MRAVVKAGQWHVEIGEQLANAMLDCRKCVFGKNAASNTRLIGDHDQCVARLGEHRGALCRSLSQLDSPWIDVVWHVIDERPVLVEEHRRNRWAGAWHGNSPGVSR